MNDKTTILTLIQQALKTPTKAETAELRKKITDSDKPLADRINAVLPKTGSTFEENIALFKKNADELKADFYPVKSLDEIIENLKTIAETEGWKKIATHGNGDLKTISDRLGLPAIYTDKKYDVHELEKCDASITLCDALVAQTGSVIVTSRTNKGRAISVLPPHHIVIAFKDQLIPSLPEAFAFLKKKYGGDLPSMASIITGPSRTGDIERILVLGAHGPKKLTIYLVI
ncbi:MAG: lactate utilization protein [Verrucomicrobiae bacterium]|nr:lactate utilization protein [Verrucomicrobiae bacterium]